MHPLIEASVTNWIREAAEFIIENKDMAPSDNLLKGAELVKAFNEDTSRGDT